MEIPTAKKPLAARSRCARPYAAVLLCLALAGCASCSRSAARDLPPGPLLSETIRFQFAVYFLPMPPSDALARLDAVLAREFPGFRKLRPKSEVRKGMFLSARMVEDVRGSYPPPDATSLKYCGRGLSAQQGVALQASRSALALDFRLSREHAWEGLRSACQVGSKMARATGGLLWDNETREVFSPDEWDHRRLATWTEQVPDVAKHMTIEFYKKGDFVRAITLGMVKFGLPDLVVEGLPWSSEQSMGNLINSLGQALTEGAQVGRAGEMTLRLRDLRNTAARERQVLSLKQDTKGEARLRLLRGAWKTGDPTNPLIEIGFDRYPGADMTERQDALLSALFGATDSITHSRHDDQELLAASRHARKKLPLLRQAYQKGLAPAEYILLKAPFAVPNGGTEWMWVEVVSWNGSDIKGILKNDSFYISGLHAGKIVAVSEQQIFDYIRRFPDGTEQGNETGMVLERQSHGKQ